MITHVLILTQFKDRSFILSKKSLGTLLFYFVTLSKITWNWNYNYFGYVNLLAVYSWWKNWKIKNDCSEFLILIVFVCPSLELIHICLLGFCQVII